MSCCPRLAVVMTAAVTLGACASSAPSRETAQAAPPAASQAASAPSVVITPAPQLIWVPQWGMYVVEGHDIVYYKAAYYYFFGDRWYSARSYAGPWSPVRPPAAVTKLPRGRLYSHLPPALARKVRSSPADTPAPDHDRVIY